jgi:hypothetical protein
MAKMALSETAQENMKLRGEVHDLADVIAGDVHHGECFYEKDMLDDFIKNLDKMKDLAQKYYDSNKKEMEEDNDE